jgi:hypothetical protein
MHIHWDGNFDVSHSPTKVETIAGHLLCISRVVVAATKPL